MTHRQQPLGGGASKGLAVLRAAEASEHLEAEAVEGERAGAPDPAR
jgi:hypothetical protein